MRINCTFGIVLKDDLKWLKMQTNTRTLRRIIEFTQVGGEINAIANGINVGAQPYWNAEATFTEATEDSEHPWGIAVGQLPSVKLPDGE